MTELWKANTRLPPSPWESRRKREIPTFPQLRRQVVLLERKRTQKTKKPKAVYTKVLTPPRFQRALCARLPAAGASSVDAAILAAYSGTHFFSGEPGLLERLFHLAENETTVRRELLAGLTTFMTMGYVCVVNPRILAEAGMPVEGVLFATCISAALATLVMGLWANYPIALAPGMSLNAYFTYSIVAARHHAALHNSDFVLRRERVRGRAWPSTARRFEGSSRSTSPTCCCSPTPTRRRSTCSARQDAEPELLRARPVHSRAVLTRPTQYRPQGGELPDQHRSSPTLRTSAPRPSSTSSTR